MRTAILLVGGLAALVALLRLVALVLVRRSAETLEFAGPVRALEVAVGDGEVTVRGGRRTDARVRRTIRHGLRRPRVTEVVDDGVLRLGVSSGVVQYEVDVPRRASVAVHGRTASATVIGVGGAVNLRAGAGSLEGRALTAPEVHAATSTGSIRLSFDRAPTLVEVATEDGTVELELPEGPTEVRTNTPGPVVIRSR